MLYHLSKNLNSTRNIMAKIKFEANRAGKDKLFGFFVGQVMKESKGKANPQIVNQLLKELLS